jgi:3-phosphoshikimate 1-carboxyvinyltransferase
MQVADSTELLHLAQLPSSIQGSLSLDGSKSISNRALIILALAGADPAQYLTGLSTSKDTQTLLRLLQSRTSTDTFDAGDAGTVFRFMAAYLATQPGTQILTGSARMLERPIGALADALIELGADMQYLGKTGYPPLKIGTPNDLGRQVSTLSIEAGVSSQFLSALLMIAPYLPQGLRLVPQGRLVSRPYIDLTLSLMRHFGAECGWEGEALYVRPGTYTPRAVRVEADWSAASYWYSMMAIAPSGGRMFLGGLFAESAQGDAVVANMMRKFGVQSEFTDAGVWISKTDGVVPPPFFEQDFLECPDIAQTLAVTCAALGTQGLFSGLETLSIKETDRISAIRDELKKVGASMIKLPARFNAKSPEKTYYMVEGKADLVQFPQPQFATYGDHRMAMAFAPFAFLGPVTIANPQVVVKSYARYWEDLAVIRSGQ